MRNRKAIIINTVAWCILIFGIIGGFALGEIFQVASVRGSYYSYTVYSYNWGLAIGSVIASIIISVLFQGFAEIIELLDWIKNTPSREEYERDYKTLEDIRKNVYSLKESVSNKVDEQNNND